MKSFQPPVRQRNSRENLIAVCHENFSRFSLILSRRVPVTKRLINLVVIYCFLEGLWRRTLLWKLSYQSSVLDRVKLL